MSAQPFTSGVEASLSFAHRMNIERYKKLLASNLTDVEREFVKRRLAEEEVDLRHLFHSAP